jgi:hypothetical protein
VTNPSIPAGLQEPVGLQLQEPVALPQPVGLPEPLQIEIVIPVKDHQEILNEDLGLPTGENDLKTPHINSPEEMSGNDSGRFHDQGVAKWIVIR